MKCHEKNATGKPCGAPAIGDTNRCVMHSGRADELGSRGSRHKLSIVCGCSANDSCGLATLDEEEPVPSRMGLDPRRPSRIVGHARQQRQAERVREGSEIPRIQAMPQVPPGFFSVSVGKRREGDRNVGVA